MAFRVCTLALLLSCFLSNPSAAVRLGDDVDAHGFVADSDEPGFDIHVDSETGEGFVIPRGDDGDDADPDADPLLSVTSLSQKPDDDKGDKDTRGQKLKQKNDKNKKVRIADKLKEKKNKLVREKPSDEDNEKMITVLGGYSFPENDWNDNIKPVIVKELGKKCPGYPEEWDKADLSNKDGYVVLKPRKNGKSLKRKTCKTKTKVFEILKEFGWLTPGKKTAKKAKQAKKVKKAKENRGSRSQEWLEWEEAGRPMQVKK